MSTLLVVETVSEDPLPDFILFRKPGASILEFCNEETDALKKYAIDLGRRYRKFSEKNGSEVRSGTKGTGLSGQSCGGVSPASHNLHWGLYEDVRASQELDPLKCRIRVQAIAAVCVGHIKSLTTPVDDTK